MMKGSQFFFPSCTYNSWTSPISLQHFIVLFLFLFFPELFIDLRSLLDLHLDQNGVKDQWMKREEEEVMWSGSWWFDLLSRVSYLSWISFCWKKIQILRGISFQIFYSIVGFIIEFCSDNDKDNYSKFCTSVFQDCMAFFS
jgi:hypothetical protein